MPIAAKLDHNALQQLLAKPIQLVFQKRGTARCTAQTRLPLSSFVPFPPQFFQLAGNFRFPVLPSFPVSPSESPNRQQQYERQYPDDDRIHQSPNGDPSFPVSKLVISLRQAT